MQECSIGEVRVQTNKDEVRSPINDYEGTSPTCRAQQSSYTLDQITGRDYGANPMEKQQRKSILNKINKNSPSSYRKGEAPVDHAKGASDLNLGGSLENDPGRVTRSSDNYA